MGSEQGRQIRRIGVAMVTWGLLGLLLSIRAVAQEGSEKLPQAVSLGHSQLTSVGPKRVRWLASARRSDSRKDTDAS